MASSTEPPSKKAKEEPPKALVYSSRSALVVVGSTASCSCIQAENGAQSSLNSDQDARKIHQTFVRDAKFMDESKTKLILSSSNHCNKEGVIAGIKQQLAEVSGEDSLFIFVYTGRACDRWDHELGLNIGEEDGFVEVSPDTSVERFSLVLNHYGFASPETCLSGSTIGTTIQQQGKPSQVLLILECPHANEIAEGLRGSLSNCDYLEFLVPLGRKHTPCYVTTLNCSAFTYFFSLFVSKAQYVTGLFPVRKVLIQVEKCCKALSCLDMVPEGNWIKSNATIPEADFMKIPRRAEIELKIKETDNTEAGVEETDGVFEFQPLIEKIYAWKKSFLWLFKKDVKPCTEAVDWARAVTNVYISILEAEGVLEGAVLEAVIGSIVFSITTIQIQKEGSGSSSNFFTQAFMLAVAAVDFIHPNHPELQKTSVAVSAAKYFMRANEGSSDKDKKSIEELIETLKADS